MALPDFLKSSAGTPIVWGVPGSLVMGLAVTKDMSLDALANGAGRNGVWADLGADWEQAYAVWVVAETGTAPAAGNVVEVYFSLSPVSSVFPGKATGTDAAYSATPSVATNKQQLRYAVSFWSLLLTRTLSRFRIAESGTHPLDTSRLCMLTALGQALRDEVTASEQYERNCLSARSRLNRLIPNK
jgi:hypothetical protein